jgi:hypothetical protein
MRCDNSVVALTSSTSTATTAPTRRSIIALHVEIAIPINVRLLGLGASNVAPVLCAVSHSPIVARTILVTGVASLRPTAAMGLLNLLLQGSAGLGLQSASRSPDPHPTTLTAALEATALSGSHEA